VRLTVTDSGGLSDTTSVLIYPETTTITMASSPTGLSLDLNGESVATPFTRTVIVGSDNALNAPSPQSLGGSSYEFASWSDGGAQAHDVVVSSPVTYTATYTQATTVGVSIETTKFTPKNSAIALGQIVRWTNISAVNHNVTDTSGMGYFGSGTIAPAGTYEFTFAAAGNFPYRSTLGPGNMTGSVSVPMVVSPTTGGTSTSFTVTWASAPLPAGYVADVQIRRPGTSTWSNWRLNQTVTSTTFVPDAGTGTYEFRARLKNPGLGSAAYSSPFAIVVS
jgi:plastocyanin